MKTIIGKGGARGFTLIELLVVIAIIGILSSVVLASVNTAREKARVAKGKMELTQFQRAVEMYYDQNRSYPCPGHWYPGADGDPTSCLRAALAPYISFPSLDPWGSYYVWHLHPGTCECTSFVSMGPDKAYAGYAPPPYHCVANGDDQLVLISNLCQ